MDLQTNLNVIKHNRYTWMFVYTGLVYIYTSLVGAFDDGMLDAISGIALGIFIIYFATIEADYRIKLWLALALAGAGALSAFIRILDGHTGLTVLLPLVIGIVSSVDAVQRLQHLKPPATRKPQV